MRTTVILAALSLLWGCASAPKPPECKGEYRPVNVERQKGASMDGTGRVVRCEEEGAHGKQG